MAMSLEDLLADEGFQDRKSKTTSRASSGIVSSKIPIYPARDEHKLSASVRLRKTEKAYSDANQYDLKVESPLTDKPKGRRSIDVAIKEKNVRKSTNETKETHIRRGAISSIANYQKSVKPSDSSSSRSRSTHNKGDNHDIRVRGSVNIEQSFAKLALDKLAIKAIISIFSDHTKRFIKDQDFRKSMHQNCLSVLSFTELKQNLKVISNLEQAIETIERATEENLISDAKDLKKAALQLSVITGLNENDLKDGFTSGISNSMLSACGHLYLSIIYQLHKKERISAKHLLQVFCDSPFSARTTLVPELWDHIFHPHMLHLDEWYNREVGYLADDLSNTRKIKKIKKFYDEIVDVGTYQFALYYKDWLTVTDDVDGPTIPTIDVPLVSFQGIQQGGSFGLSLDFSTPANAFTPQHIMSKKLNEAVAADLEDRQTVQGSDDGIQSYDGLLVEDKMIVTDSLEEDEYKNLHIKQYEEPLQDGLDAQETLELDRANALGKYRNSIMQQEGQQTLPIAKVNELTLKLLSKSVFELQRTERSVSVIETTSRPVIFCDIPKEYLCPLTGLLFKDPVTLENGQTFDRAAIAEWFSKGNKACPITGELLECSEVPRTNLILKRVINGWKTEHPRSILAYACQVAGSPCEHKSKDQEAVFILEQLFTVFGDNEDKRIVKQLIAFGGLQFLIKRFEFGDMDEKTRVAAMLSCCIKADSGCRINVARSIEKHRLFELLHCKEVKSIANAVVLLFELICLNRRKDVQFFLNGLQKETITSSMHILLVFLQASSPDQKPLVAVLLLHLDLMVDQKKYSIYRNQAVDTITSALNTSLSNEKVQVTCCRALLILGGRISFSGKVMTEDWILKKAGFLDGPEFEIQECKEDEKEAVNDWLMMMSASLVGDGKKSFLDSLSQWLNCGNRDMKRVCLTTMAWLSSTLVSLPNYESQLSALSVVIHQLKENLKDGERVEHRILAVMSLLNFSKIPECRDILMKIANEITIPLRDLCEATLMANELYALISQKDQ